MSPSSDSRADSSGRLGLPAGRRGPLRRRPQARRVPDGHPRPFVEWVKVCPEVESGMGTPREPIRLVNQDGRMRLLTVKTGVDHTDAMTALRRARADELATEDLCGYVLKKDSPSCGMTRVKVYGGARPGHQIGRRPVRPGAAGALSRPARRRRGSPPGSAIARKLHRARLRLSPAPRSVRVALDGRRSGPVPHRAQARADGALATGIRTARTPGGRRERRAAARPCAPTTARGSWRRSRSSPRRSATPTSSSTWSATSSAPLDAGSRDELLATIEDYRRGSCRSWCR